jgi:cytochrome c-type biogenesis protein CcmH/NrfG
MTEQSKTRRQKLEEFLGQNPNDAFCRYSIALDSFRQGELPAAEVHFQYLLSHNADYVPAYQMYAQLLAQSNRTDEARTVLQRGIEAAQQQGNQHARSEMESHLGDLG